MDKTDKILRALIALALLLASAALWWPAPAEAARIKELASVQGVRSNPLVGYGLVVGLDGTGGERVTWFSNDAHDDFDGFPMFSNDGKKLP